MGQVCNLPLPPLGKLPTCPTRIHRLKLRIAIVVIGLLTGLLAREAVKYYRQFRAEKSISPPAAATSPVIRAERRK